MGRDLANYRYRVGVAVVLFLGTFTHPQMVPAAGLAIDLNPRPMSVAEVTNDLEANRKILVEIFLSQTGKKDIENIKNQFNTFSITKIRPQFFQLGDPPRNIAVGKNISADVARLAIRIATTYNHGIIFIIAEKRLAPDYLAIGTSMLDETYQFPITPEDLKKLADPALTTPQFHSLYRHLTGDDH